MSLKHIVPPRDPAILAEWHAPTRAELLAIIPDATPLYRDLAGLVADYLPGTETKFPPIPPLPADYVPKPHNIYIASQDGDLQQIQWLIECNGEDVNNRICHWSPFELVVCWPDLTNVRLQCARYLVSRGADPANQHYNGSTALMIVCGRAHWDAARYLLYYHNDIPSSNPADPPRRLCDITDNTGRSILNYTVEFDNPELLRDLILQFGMDPMHTFRGWSLLQWAARYDRVDIARFLVEEIGLDPNRQEGGTPMNTATNNRSDSVIQYLRSPLAAEARTAKRRLFGLEPPTTSKKRG